MKKIFMVLLLITTMLMAGCAEKKSSTTVIRFEEYGGFRIDDTRRVILVDNETINYVAYREDKLIAQVVKRIDPDVYNELVQKFSNFQLLKDTYTLPDDVAIADAPSAKITLTKDNIPRTVSLEPYVEEYLPDDVKVLARAMQSLLDSIYVIPEPELKSLAETWIKKAPTYMFDGSELEFVSYEDSEALPPTYTVTYKFKSSAGGYGNRDGLMLIQVITDHEIVLAIQKYKVISAIIDNKYDELHQRMIGTYPITFHPLQCVDAPWRAWYKRGKTQFVKEPSEEELMQAFYSSNYDIEINNISMKTNGTAIIICGDPEPYYYKAMADNNHVDELLKLGWKENAGKD
ncbi:TPA: hypothetical protein HA235_04805 [Candidatus Woesearchaeota archaeon]|nr:hypothetical protein [Candidatus Woesearchaeota archaeon]HIH32000.1 hypothetical protein [Candidatus Woesearchaeota archaeon]HIH54884.1 hypothetical protein [Candidatus Woesearchaeota archaeon]HIJ02019.1 hypothetical protein [Candidatus Woesearchaeota archaeon]HIJ13280.1 hypothetical protein [Candidatus Woesearchaeota archaeon]